MKDFKNYTPTTPPARRSQSTTKRRSAFEWDIHKEFIRDIYVVQKQTAEKVLEALNDKDFVVSHSQLQPKLRAWGFKQKMMLSPDQRLIIAQNLSKRASKRKKRSIIKRDGEELDEQNVRRTLRRHETEDAFRQASNYEGAVNTISVETPSPCDSAASTPQYFSPKPNTPRFRNDLETIIDMVDEDVDMLGQANDNMVAAVAGASGTAPTPKTIDPEIPRYNSNVDINLNAVEEDIPMHSIDALGEIFSDADLSLTLADSLRQSSPCPEYSSRGSDTTGTDSETLDDIVSIATVSRKQRRYDEALEWYKRALAGYEKALGKDHPSTLNTVHNMALVFYEQGRYDKALEWYKRALAGYEKALGKDHPSTLDTVHNMAGVFDEQGRYDKALEWYERALVGSEKVLGKDHPSTLDTVHNMAVVFYKQGWYGKALEWYKRALAGYEKALGKGHPSTLDTVYNIAIAFNKQGRYDEALEWYKRALAGYEKALGKDHPLMLRTINHIFRLQSKLKRVIDTFN